MAFEIEVIDFGKDIDENQVVDTQEEGSLAIEGEGANGLEEDVIDKPATDAPDEEEVVEDKDKVEPAPDEKTEPSDAENNKAFVDFLLGKYKVQLEEYEKIDFEDQEVVDKVIDALRAVDRHNASEQEIDSAGEEGSIAFRFFKSGGTMADFEKLVASRSSVFNIDITTPEGKEQAVRLRYKESKLSERAMQAVINDLKDEGEEAFNSAAEESLEFLKEQRNKEDEALIAANFKAKQEEQKRREDFELQLREIANKIPDIKERKERLNYWSVIPKGETMTAFDKDFRAIKNNPESMDKLIWIVKNFNNVDVVDKSVKTVTKDLIKAFKIKTQGQGFDTVDPVRRTQQKEEFKITPIK